MTIVAGVHTRFFHMEPQQFPILCALLESEHRIGSIDELTSHYALIPRFLHAAERNPGLNANELREACRNTIVRHKHTIDLGQVRPDYTPDAWFSISNTPTDGPFHIPTPSVEGFGFDERVCAIFDITLRFEDMPNPRKPPQMLIFRRGIRDPKKIVDSEICIPYELNDDGLYALPFTIARPLLLNMMAFSREVTRFSGGGLAELQWSTVRYHDDARLATGLSRHWRRVRYRGFTLRYEGGYAFKDTDGGSSMMGSIASIIRMCGTAAAAVVGIGPVAVAAAKQHNPNGQPILSIYTTIPYQRLWTTR